VLSQTVTYEEPQAQFLEPQEWIGYEVYDPLGQKIGQAEEILVNAENDPEYIRVRIDSFGPKTVLIPVHLAAADAERHVIELR
jgi:ribosomal 30S subunit maturation factor RimM